MLITLKDYFVKKRLENNLRQKKHFRHRMSLKNVENVLVILPEKTPLQKQLPKIATALKITKHQITTLKICEHCLENEYEENHFSKKDFNIFGGVASEKLKEIVDKKYSVLINLNTMLNYYSDCVNLRVKSDLKIGFAEKENATIADLLISVRPKEFDLFCAEMEKYIQILQLKQ